jgi:hypothetical protein
VLLAGQGIRRAALTCGAAVLAVAAGGASGAYAATSQYSTSYDFASGQVTVPAAGFPAAHISTDSTNPTSPSGASAFLNSSTPFGQAFGSSQGEPYALLHLATGRKPSTTVITFDSSPAAGTWGFALGDVDAENVQVQAYGPGDTPLPVSDLGFEGTFNFCTGKPLPSTCKGMTGTDRPNWDASTGTLRGNVADTDGASGWFRPSASITKLVLTATLNSGIPAFQLWIAAEDRPKPPSPHHHHPKPVEPAAEAVAPDVPVSTSPGEPVTIPVCTGSARAIDVSTAPSHGTLSTDAADCAVTYGPSGDFDGQDYFSLKITEPNGKVVVKHFDVTVGLAKTGAYHLPALAAGAAALLLLGSALTVLASRRAGKVGER